jgi:hypothetical protein
MDISSGSFNLFAKAPLICIIGTGDFFSISIGITLTA